MDWRSGLEEGSRSSERKRPRLRHKVLRFMLGSGGSSRSSVKGEEAIKT